MRNYTGLLQQINKIKDLKSKVLKVVRSNFNTVEVHCKDIHMANYLLNKNDSQTDYKAPFRGRKCKGIIEWDGFTTGLL